VKKHVALLTTIIFMLLSQGTNCGTIAATVCYKSKMIKVPIEFFGE